MGLNRQSTAHDLGQRRAREGISPLVPNLGDPHDDKFSGVFFLDANIGWIVSSVDTNDTTPYGTAVGSDALLSSTTDGGATWTTGKLPRADTVRDSGGSGAIAFSDRLHGWFDLALTGNTAVQPGALFVTSDGGQTWKRAKGDPKVSIEIVALNDKDVWFAGGPDDLLYVTHDSANTVQEVSLPNPKEIDPEAYPVYGIPVFTDSLNGYEQVTYTNGDEKSAEALFATTDGGRTWRVDRVLTNLDPSTAERSSPSALVGSTWLFSFAPDGSQTTLVKIHPNEKRIATANKNGHDGFNGCELSFLTADEGWMNCSGILSSTIDGGASWASITPRVRNGVLTMDPITPVPVPKPMKTHPLTLANPKPGQPNW